MKKKHYTARWALAGRPSTANVTIVTSHAENAKKIADKIAREMGVTNTPRTIMFEGRVIECFDKGVR